MSPDKLTQTENWEMEPSDYTADLSLGPVHSDFCMGQVIARVQRRKGEGMSNIRTKCPDGHREWGTKGGDHEKEKMRERFSLRT